MIKAELERAEKRRLEWHVSGAERRLVALSGAHMPKCSPVASCGASRATRVCPKVCFELALSREGQRAKWPVGSVLPLEQASA